MDRNPPSLWDTHCHLLDPAIPGGPAAALDRAARVGVVRVTLVESEPRRWREAVAFARSEPTVKVACGVHPCFVGDAGDDALSLLEELAPSLDALGEIGLDRTAPDLDRQLAFFRAQLDIAARFGLPVLVHCRRAFPALLDELSRTPPPAGVMHCYSGGPHYVGPLSEAGMYFSFAAPVADPRAVKVRKALAAVPSERLLVETDSPDMTPRHLRPAPNEPANLPHVARAAADALGMDYPSFAETTFANAARFFDS